MELVRLIGQGLTHVGNYLQGKTAREVMGSRTHAYSGGFIDAYNRRGEPRDKDLIKELKNVAWTCITINSMACAHKPPKLYVRTLPGQPKARCKTIPVKDAPMLLPSQLGTIEQVVEHPILDLFDSVNETHNSFDLWEITQFYLESIGSAFWLLDMDGLFGVPYRLWILPAQRVTPRREPNSQQVVDYYEYDNDGEHLELPPERVIHFKFPDIRDPYNKGMSPLKAVYEQISMASQYTSMRHAIYENSGLPGVIISPDEIISEEERDRLELQWNAKFRRGGQGKALVAESGLKTQILNQQMGDLSALAEMKATKEDVANAFQIPIPFLSKETNLANMKAADELHKRLAIRPRLRRRDEKLNETLIPLYDPTGRLFLSSEDPFEEERKLRDEQAEKDLKAGIRSINEVRMERGLPPVPWGNLPYAQDPTQQTPPPGAPPGQPGPRPEPTGPYDPDPGTRPGPPPEGIFE